MADENRSLHDDRARIRFAFDFDPLFRLAALPFGVAPDRAHVTVDDDRLIVRFGPWRLDTPLDNVVGAEVSGPFALPKVIGPPHLSLRDRGLTFATNARQGVCIRFGAPVAGLLPLPQLRHPAVTVTVAEAATLAALLDRERHDDRASDSGEGVTVGELAQEVSDDLQALTATELRERARELGIANASRMKKAELIDALTPSR